MIIKVCSESISIQDPITRIPNLDEVDGFLCSGCSRKNVPVGLLCNRFGVCGNEVSIFLTVGDAVSDRSNGGVDIRVLSFPVKYSYIAAAELSCEGDKCVKVSSFIVVSFLADCIILDVGGRVQ